MDALSEGGLAHSASLAAPAHSHVSRVALDADQGGETAVGSQHRVDVLFQELGDPLRDLAFQDQFADVAQRVGSVRVADDQAALHRVARQIKGGPGQLRLALIAYRELQAAELPPVAGIRQLRDGREGQVVDVVDARHAGYVDL